MKKRNKVHFPGLGLRTPVPESRKDSDESQNQEPQDEYQDIIEEVMEYTDEVMGEEENFDPNDPLLLRDSRGRPLFIDGKPVYCTLNFHKWFLATVDEEDDEK
jgi:hypothetical protein